MTPIDLSIPKYNIWISLHTREQICTRERERGRGGGWAKERDSLFMQNQLLVLSRNYLWSLLIQCHFQLEVKRKEKPCLLLKCISVEMDWFAARQNGGFPVAWLRWFAFLLWFVTRYPPLNAACKTHVWPDTSTEIPWFCVYKFPPPFFAPRPQLSFLIRFIIYALHLKRHESKRFLFWTQI